MDLGPRISGKRKRGSPLSALKKAQIASYKFSHLYPWSSHGAARIERGTELSRSAFGESYKSASEAQRNNRKALGFTGRGKYSFGKFLRSAEPIADRFLKKGIPNILNATGRGMYTGLGMYHPTTNSLISGSVHNEPHYHTLDEEGALCISNKEYVSEIYGNPSSTLFSNNGYSLNPGLESVFPWLSQLAMNYEEYEFQQVIFEYRSLVQDVNSNNGQVGSIIMATNYNPNSKNFADKAVMQAYAHANSFKSTDNGVHGVECDPAKLSGPVGRYVRTNPTLVGEDLKSFDHAKFQIAIHNTPSSMANQAIGELWVTYKVVLRKPKLFSARGLGISRSLYVGGGGYTTSLVLGSQANLLRGQQNNIPTKVDLSSNTISITFPAYFNGDLIIALAIEGSGFTVGLVSAAPVLSGQVSFIRDVYAGTNGATTTQPGWWRSSCQTTNGQFEAHVRVKSAVGGIDNKIVITTVLASSAPTQGVLDIYEYNSGFNTSLDTDGYEIPTLVGDLSGTVVTV